MNVLNLLEFQKNIWILNKSNYDNKGKNYVEK